jgi:hypothetical protein
MSVGNSRIGVEVSEVKCRGNVSIPGWYASARVVATNVDGRKTQGWVHLAKSGPSIRIESYDEYDEVDPGMLGFVVATESEAIIAAVRARIAETRIAA